MSWETSSLEPFVKKIPKKVQTFCMDLSILQADGGWKSFCDQLERKQADCSDLPKQTSNLDKKVDRLTEDINDKKSKLKAIEETFQSAAKLKKAFFENGDFEKYLKLAVKSEIFGFVTKCALQRTNLDDDITKLKEIITAQETESNERCTFQYDGSCDVQLLEQVSKKASSEASSSGEIDTSVGRRLVSKFNSKGDSTPSVDEELAKIRIVKDGKARLPTNAEEWDRVHRGLTLRKMISDINTEYAEDLERCGCPHDKIFGKSGEDIENLKSLLMEALELKKAFSPELRKDLDKLRVSLEKNQELQVRHRQLCEEIQKLEAEWISSKIRFEQSKKVQRGLSRLNHLTQVVFKMKSGDSMHSKDLGAKARYGEFVQALRAFLEYVPLLVITVEQLSEFVPPEHQFSVLIGEELTKSDCTGLNMFIRSERMVPLGDNKQGSPSWHNWSEESKIALKASQPDMPSANKLMPGNSLFDLVNVASPESCVLLKDAFRVPSEGFAWSNETLYHDKINTYKPTGGDKTMRHIRIGGGKWDKKTKTNEKEAHAIVKYLIEIIKAGLSHDVTVPLTVYIISMAGSAQSQLIEQLVDESLVPLRIEFRSKLNFFDIRTDV